MKLPDNKVGISDLIDYLECGRRFEFKMRRHTDAGEPPEALDWTNAYGSAIHSVLHHSGAGLSDEEAVQVAFNEYGRFLDPGDLALLKEDLALYHTRDPQGVRLVANETEIKVPIMEWEGETIYFRGKIDRLYERLDSPGSFIHVDYKSSKWAKSAQEVHEDKQMWAYNFGIHEFWPEVETLVHIYDQLRYGQLTTRKNAEQREQMREWLIAAATKVLEEDDPKPTWNQWCAYCPISESCPIIDELSDYALAEIAALAPEEKEGRKTHVKLDPALFDAYVEQLPKVGRAKLVLEHFEKAVKDTLKKVPANRLAQYSYSMQERKSSTFTTEALRAIHEMVGDEFYEIIALTKKAVETYAGDNPELLDQIMARAVSQVGTQALVAAK